MSQNSMQSGAELTVSLTKHMEGAPNRDAATPDAHRTYINGLIAPSVRVPGYVEASEPLTGWPMHTNIFTGAYRTGLKR